MRYINEVIVVSHTFEQLRTAAVGRILWPLVASLSKGCHNRLIVSALLVLKWHYASMEPDDRGLFQTRGYACEIVAWRFLTHLSEPELIKYLLYDLPSSVPQELPSASNNVYGDRGGGSSPTEDSSLLRDEETLDLRPSAVARDQARQCSSVEGEDLSPELIGLNALEIAAVAEAKQFLSQRVVQKIVNGIWSGDIVFWNSMNSHTVKNAQRYKKRYVVSIAPSWWISS